MLWLLVAIFVASIFYYFILKPLQYWKRLNVPQDSLGNVLVGLFEYVTARRSIGEVFENLYNKFPNKRYCGSYQMGRPILLLRDSELIKQITVKDFDSFSNHTQFLPDEIWHENLISLKGQKWKDMRTTLSPAFTSGKLKTIYPLILECATQFVKYFEQKKERVVIVDVREDFAKYSNDVIATTAYGITCNSIDNPKNIFYQMGQALTNFSSIWTNLKVITIMVLPKVAAHFNFSLFDSKVVEYFNNIMSETIKLREERGVQRFDMIDLLLQAKHDRARAVEEPEEDDQLFPIAKDSHTQLSNAKKAQLTDKDIFQQAFLFFLGGFETVSAMLSFTVYALACNPDIQEKLYQEIQEYREIYGHLPTYDRLMKLEYLSMVVLETLRLYPSTPATERMCVKPFTIQPKREGEVPVHINVGQTIFIPILGIHRDSEIFPNADQFDPERFSKENKDKIVSGSFVPFGSGPRLCIGNRLALMEIKTLIYLILSSFEIVAVDKTPIPARYSKSQFSFALEAGASVGFKKRD